jgi:mannose-1-phosphate guanylyltransferase
MEIFMTLVDRTLTKSHEEASNAVPGSLPHAQIISRIRAVILLAGVVRNTKFNEGIERSLLALPLDSETTLIRHWYEHACALTRVSENASLPLRILVDPQSILPVTPKLQDATPLIIERDPLEFRGTGGVLLDATLPYTDDEYVLVGNAACVLLNNLGELVSQLAACAADIALLAEPDGSPTGLMLVRCGTLRHISPIGFVDLNEQALPAIAAKYTVRVLRHNVERYPVRNLPEYIQALRQYHLNRHSGHTVTDPFAENWLSTFSITEDLQTVASTASLLDSVVLKGARVQEGAVVVRSVVCPGATVRARATVIDEIVTA